MRTIFVNERTDNITIRKDNIKQLFIYIYTETSEKRIQLSNCFRSGMSRLVQ